MGIRHINNKYRKIYEKHYGSIPKGYHIHHIDFNPLNNDPSNLIAVSPEEHAKIHSHDGIKWCVEAGIAGGHALYNKMTEDERRQWHSKGGKKSKNSGGYNMKQGGKNNIKEARLKSKKYVCALCPSKPMDGGNIIKHIHIKHKIPKEECINYRTSFNTIGAKVDN